jgi:hypothetical protein
MKYLQIIAMLCTCIGTTSCLEKISPKPDKAETRVYEKGTGTTVEDPGLKLCVVGTYLLRDLAADVTKFGLSVAYQIEGLKNVQDHLKRGVALNPSLVQCGDLLREATDALSGDTEGFLRDVHTTFSGG